MEMPKRIELESRAKKPAEIVELNLDNCRASQVEGLSDKFENLKNLSLINVGLTTLKGFPNLPNLKKLELSDNRITTGLQHLCGCTKLEHLTLSGNKIKDIETLKPLAALENLSNLDLFNCEVTALDDYKERMFELLPNLNFLDGYDKDDREADEEEDEGVEGEAEDEEEEDEEGEEDEEDEDGDDDDDDEDEIDDEEDDEEGVDFDDEEDDEEESNLDILQQENLEDESDGEFEPGEGEDDDEEFDEEEEEGETLPQGVKRKREDDGEEEEDD